jgi:protein KTI12
VEIATDDRAQATRADYETTITEKISRGAIKSLVERLLTPDTIVIVDSLNTIKGFRYELHCQARALKTHQCTIFCDIPIERCQQWVRYRYDIVLILPLTNPYRNARSRNQNVIPTKYLMIWSHV